MYDSTEKKVKIAVYLRHLTALKSNLLICILTFIQVANSSGQQQDGFFDFSSAFIVIPTELTPLDRVTLDLLVEEIASRSLIELQYSTQWPSSDTPVILLSTRISFNELTDSFNSELFESKSSDAKEGFSIRFVNNTRDAPTVLIIGNDSRGMLYGAGYFLRKIQMTLHKLDVPTNLGTDTWPQTALRGHQMGYRPKANSYDGWDVDQWEQYIRDLVVFGTNAVEIMPPNTDDRPWSVMFPRPAMDMMIIMTELLDKYDMDTWIWYPLMHGDYTNSENVAKSLEENEQVFSQLKRVDALFIPGGDPGRAHPRVLFDYLEKQAEVLHRYHPGAEIWVSPQSFTNELLDSFIELANEEPDWLAGVIYGPQVMLDIAQLRTVISPNLRIRKYPDITHTYDAQYPVPEWDHAFAATQNREPINPRPLDQAVIFRAPNPEHYYGFITYSEGINDDVNKFIWSGLGWDRNADVADILRDYSRYFIGYEYANDFAQILLDLENNWRGPLLSNTSVQTTFLKFKDMEKKALPLVRTNWRFILAQFRAWYDIYTRTRLIQETYLEEKAIESLRQAPRYGSEIAMKQAEDILLTSLLEPPAADLRQRIFELAEALFQTIRMQKTVDTYFASAVRRGANLNLIDWPLNNRVWLMNNFSRIREIENERARLVELDLLVNWANPGAGGYYTDLGKVGDQPNVIIERDYTTDPAFLSSPFAGFVAGSGGSMEYRLSWARYMQTLYGQPLRMQYSDLDPQAQYQIKVTYLSQYRNQRVSLYANGDIEVHPFFEKDFPIHVGATFDIPWEATKDGELLLEWVQDLGLRDEGSGQYRVGGTGRGNQVAEVWLIKKTH